MEEKLIKNLKWILLGIFILAFVLRVIFIFSSPLLWWDETVYANLGHDLSKNPLDYSLKNAAWGDFIPDNSWPHIGFRPPILPYLLSIFYFFRLEFLIRLIIPLIGALTCIVLYFFVKRILNIKIALLSSLLLALTPLHVFYSSRIMNDSLVTFFTIVVFYCFYRGFEEQSNKYKILFGLFLALALLSRYTTFWIIPVFLLYFLVRDRSVKFLFDKYFWYSVLSFFIVLIPWLIYGFFEYGNIFGPFLHGFKSAPYWGGIQNWSFFISSAYNMVSILGILLVCSLVYIFYGKHHKNKEIYFLLLWFFIFFIFASLMPHKEDRFILPLVPVVCILVSFFIFKLPLKKLGVIVLILLTLILLALSLYNYFNFYYSISHNINARCFSETNNYLTSLNSSYTTFSENSPLLFYYTKNKSSFLPPIDSSLIRHAASSKEGDIYFVFTRSGSGLSTEEYFKLKQILSDNFKQVYNCSLDPEVNFIYKA